MNLNGAFHPGGAEDGDCRAPAALSVTGLSVSFGGVAALTDVSFEVATGDVTAIVGPNGAGKSTALNAICGLVKGGGEVRINGARSVGLSAPKVARLGVGRSFQDPPLVAGQSVLSNLMTGAHLRLHYNLIDQVVRRRHVCKAEAEYVARAVDLLDLVGLAGIETEDVAGLPYGTRKLIDVLRAVMPKPSLLLLDEPSSGLDNHERDLLQDAIRLLNHRADVTIVAVEHHMDLVKAIAATVVVLQAGAVLAVGSPRDVLDSELVRDAFVGDAAALEGASRSSKVGGDNG